MIRGKIEGIKFQLNYNPFKIKADPDLADFLEDLDFKIYDPHQGIRIARLDEDPETAIIILSELKTAFELDIEVTEGPELLEEEHIPVKK